MPARNLRSIVPGLVVAQLCSVLTAGQDVVFQDDFDEAALGDGLSVNNYVFEENGTFAPVSELAITADDGSLRINGKKGIDTVIVEGHAVGWIGSALSLAQTVGVSESLSVEADVTVHSNFINRSGDDAGFVLYLTMEFDENNRIVFNLMESVALGARFVQMHLEESGIFMTCWGPTAHCLPRPFSNGQTLRLRLEFEPASRIAKGYIDGAEVLRRPFAGTLADARISLGAAVRGLGDTIDLSFDNLLVTQAGPPKVPLRRGDANADGQLDISDPIAILGCLFLGSDCGSCLDALDSNDDGVIHIVDPVYLLNWRFHDGAAPSAPFPACGTDPTADNLEECESFGPCTE